MRTPRKLHASAARMRELMPPDAAELEAEAAYFAARRRRDQEEALARLVERVGPIANAGHVGRSVLSEMWYVNGLPIYADSTLHAALMQWREEVLP